MKSFGAKINSIFSTYKNLPKEVYVLFLGKMINCMGAFVHPLLVIILTNKIGLSIKEAGYFVTIAAIAQFPSIMIGGKIVDKFDRKKIIVIFQSLAALVYIICSIIEPSKLLAVLMIVASCLSAVSISGYDSIVGDITDNNNRKASFSLIYMGLNLGYAIGPALGGFLVTDHLSLLFIGDAITTLISVLLISRYINKTNKSTEINSNNLESDEKGSVIKVIINRPILIFYALAMFTFQFGYSQWGYAVPIQLNRIAGDAGAGYYGLLSGLNGFIVILLTPIITTITKRKSATTIMAIGGLFYALSLGSCGIVHIWQAFFVIIIIITLGEVCIAINSGAFVANLTPKSHRGRINAIIPVIYGTGNAVGPTVMGMMIEKIGLKSAWIIVAIVVGFGSLIMYMLKFIKVKL